MAAQNQIHGRNTILEMWDSAAASWNISGDLNNVTFSWTRSNADTTTFGNTYTQRISGLRDYNLQVTAIYNAESSSGVNAVAAAHLNASANIVFKWYPATKTSGCEFWTGCTLISAYQEQAPVNGAVTLQFTLEGSSGSLSASTV